MLNSKSTDIVYDHPSKTFLGVRFVLFGLDPINKDTVRLKLVNGGGLDVGQYCADCTHVIVDKIVLDDPICVAAQNDGKALVTSLWVDHSFDVGIPVDPTSIMYRPLQDLNGIRGTKSLIICLTGYQRQDRDDIMTLVGLMGANFSKPLVANKVTHLVCYKFEGEKYELAKKMKIKLVNHRWLEDCLKAWEILPEAKYDKSGYELEMEVEAKDSEDEAEDMATKLCGEKKIIASPSLQTETRSSYQPLKVKQEVSTSAFDSSASKGLHEICNKHTEMLGSCGTGILGDVSCAEPSKPYDKTPSPAKVGNELASSSRIANRFPHSDEAKLTAISYSRKTPRGITDSVYYGEVANIASSDPAVNMDKPNVSHGFSVSSSEIEQDGANFVCGKMSLKRSKFCLPEKRKMDVSYGSSKSQKMTNNPSHMAQSPLMENSTEGLEPSSLANSPLGTSTRISPGKNAQNMDETAALNPARNSLANISTRAFSSLGKKSLTCDTSVSKTVTSEITEGGGGVEEALQTSFMGLERSNLARGLGPKHVGTRRLEGATIEVGKSQHELQDIEVPSPKTKRSEIKNSNSPTNLDMLKGGNTYFHSKPLDRKMLSKKISGSRTKLGKGNTRNQKGSIYINKAGSQDDAVTCSTGRKEMADPEIVTPTVNGETAINMEKNNVRKSGNEPENKVLAMNDETEAPEDKEEHEFEATATVEKSEKVEPECEVAMVTEENSEIMCRETNKIGGDILGGIDHAMTSGEDKKETETEMMKKTELGESTLMDTAKKEKTTKRKNCLPSKTKKKILSAVKKVMSPKEGDENEKKNNTEREDDSVPSVAYNKTKKIESVNKLDNPVVEKENQPNGNENQNVSYCKERVGELPSKSKKTPEKINIKVGKVDQDSVQMEQMQKPAAQPVWFILSGHKLQRKEFHQVIRRLKGRVCRDSHQWSYQATHFIAPDPIRRTEKFFAAAASGRWILNTDYLTASNQAGRFLAEEPYEWHKHGLSEDGSINIEAPRKWRLLRKRTGHGAFYGMRIMIYGECISPPLDTLKRVVKAGDGIILATSPPYTRFLQSGVDFAIVSPGMPCVDMWVQEFLSHEIPCVLADYLVEYVCKPGYSLDKHVQYNTHSLAEKSFKKLLNHMDEIVEHLTPPEDHDLPGFVTEER